MRRYFFATVLLVVVASSFFACQGQQINSSKRFSGIKVIFFVGGSAENPVAKLIYGGAKAAENDLGVQVEYVWSDWNADKMVLQFKDAIAKKPDAIALMGHPGDEVLEPLVEEAIRNKIIVTSQNVNLPQLEDTYFDKGFGYVGQDVYESSVSLVKVAVRKFGLQANDKVLVAGNKQKRLLGAQDELNKLGLKVEFLDIPTQLTDEEAAKVTKDYLAQNKEFKFILAGSKLGRQMAEILSGNGIKPGEIKVATFDLSLKLAQDVKSGYIGLIIDQQPYLQGYLPILQACLTKKYGFSGLHIDTGSSFIDESNIDLIEVLVKQQIR